MSSVPARLAAVLLTIGFITGEVIETPLGSIAGREGTSRDGRTYLAWTKIPYAKPPIGDLRLAAPVPVEKWEGVLQATEPMPGCRQEEFLIFKPGEEDCLHLSVYKPKIDAKNLPVLLYVHGGAFSKGHPGGPEMADYIMDENVILVAICYRLGALGFMSLNHTELPGNFGLKDQALALNWIHENIGAFGGDPKAITIFGDSAGGASVHYLLLSPLTKDLIKGAGLHSGTVTKIWSLSKTNVVKDFSEKLVDKLDCRRSSVKETLECLREINDPSLFVENSSFDKPEGIHISFGPVIEPAQQGAIVTEDVTKAKSNKPIIIGFAAGEYLLFEIPNKLKGSCKVKKQAQDLDGYSVNLLRFQFEDDEKLKSAAAKMKERYLKHDKTSIPELMHDMAMIFQDMAFIYPAMDLAETHQGAKWVYQFSHRGELSLMDAFIPMNTSVACHADEVFYFFNSRSRFRHAKDEAEPNDVRISKELIKYLVNFATHGNPTPEGSPSDWAPFNEKEILRIKTEGSEMGDAEFVKEQKDILTFWRDVFNDAITSERDEL